MPSSLTPDFPFSAAYARQCAGGVFVPLFTLPTMTQDELYDHALAVFSALWDVNSECDGKGGGSPAGAFGHWSGHIAVLGVSVAPEGSSVPTYPCDDSLYFGLTRYPDHVQEDTPGGLSPHWGGRAAESLWLDLEGTWWLRTTAPASTARTDELSKCIAHVVQHPQLLEQSTSLEWTYPNKANHHAAVEDCLEAIRAGEIYQCCISGFFTAQPHSDTDLFAQAASYFVQTAHRTHPAHALFVAGNDSGKPVVLTSFSPELYLARCAEHVYSSPIKGTIASDQSTTDLSGSAKDNAENIMIVDMLRHDFGQVARPGSVDVVDLCSVIPAPGVWHLVSTVGARIPGVGNERLTEATFPPASVTGTPKHAARGFLTQWEHENRQAHCGAVGIACGELLELGVMIRTLEWTEGSVRLGVGGGITIDSQPEAEWQEILDKAAPFIG